MIRGKGDNTAPDAARLLRWSAKLPATLNSVDRITEALEELLDKVHCTARNRMQMMVVIDELVSNIAKHAYKSVKGDLFVALVIDPDTRILELRLEDEGTPFNPMEVSDPDITLSLEERPIGGLGLFIVRKTTDGMFYKREAGRNVLTVIKRLA